jgi:hypothetical protein
VRWACFALVLAACAAKAAEILLPRPNLRRRPAALRVSSPPGEPRHFLELQRWHLEEESQATVSIAPAEAARDPRPRVRTRNTRRPMPSRADWQLIEPEISLGEGAH